MYLKIIKRKKNRNITFNNFQKNELLFNENRGGSQNRDMRNEEAKMFMQKRMEKESQVLDSNEYYGKVHNTEARKMMSSQNDMISSLISKPEQTMIKIEYFDTLLNLERKIEHFNKLFTKIKLRVIHKPFIILDMLKIMTDDRSGTNIFVSLIKKLINMRKRSALDSVIDFVEHKKELINKWGMIVKKAKRKDQREHFDIIEQDQIIKHKERNRLQKNRRGLRYLGTILNNFFREYKRNVWTNFVRKAFSEENKWEPKEVHLDISNHQGFLKGKEIKTKMGSSERGYTREEGESSMNNTTEIRNNQMNAYIYKNGKTRGSEYNSGDEDKIKKKADFDSSFEEEGGIQQVEMALNSGNVDSEKILAQIRSEIEKIQKRLDKDETNEEPLGIKEKIEMLTQLTHLMGLIKKYYESFKDDTEESKRIDRKDFEQVLIILQRVIARLLHKIPTDMNGMVNPKSRRSSQHNEEAGSVEAEQMQYDSHRLQVEMGKNLNQEMESLVNLIEPKVGLKRRMGEEGEYDTENKDEYGTQEMQSVTGINGLLEEMMQNLNVMNQNIEQPTEGFSRIGKGVNFRNAVLRRPRVEF